MSNHQFLLEIVKKYFDETTELNWLLAKIDLFKEDFKDRNFYLSFSACPRFIGKELIAFEPVDLAKLNGIYPNFSATVWSKDEMGRILLMTALPTNRNHALLDTLFSAADYRESVAMYKGLYFLENAGDFMLRAREGLRTNMVGVFDAIALHNPFPAKYLTTDAWNQMVLKAVFMERPIYKIYSIEERKNPKLALIFLDYAQERWAAHRKVTPELWRFVSGYADANFFKDMQKIILGADKLESIAATKALSESEFKAGMEWLMDNDVATTDLPNWDEIGQQLEKEITK